VGPVSAPTSCVCVCSSDALLERMMPSGMWLGLALAAFAGLMSNWPSPLQCKRSPALDHKPMACELCLFAACPAPAGTTATRRS